MNVIVHNYSSEMSSEALYVNRALQEVGCKSTIWNNECSAFDIFDMHNPQVFITTFEFLTKDILKRLQASDIMTLINVTLADDETLDRIGALDIKCELYSNKPRKGVHYIPYCADIFLQDRGLKRPEYQIDDLYVVMTKEDVDKVNAIPKTDSTWHVISPTKELSDLADIDCCVHLSNLYALYPNYQRVHTFAHNQFYCDATHYAENGVQHDGEHQKVQTPYYAASKMMELTNNQEIAEKLNGIVSSVG